MEDELLILKKIINALCKKYHLDSLQREEILHKVIIQYWYDPRHYMNGLAYTLFNTTYAYVCGGHFLAKLIMTTIHKYQPNNMYNRFQPFVEEYGLWHSLKDELPKHKGWTIEEMFCNAPLPRLVDYALVWNATPQGFHTWQKLHLAWGHKVEDESNKPTQKMEALARELTL